MSRAALATSVALLLVAAPAGAGWRESAPVKAWAGPKLNGVAVASQAGAWWAVGEGGAVVTSADGFSSAAPTPVAISGLASSAILTSVWVSPDASAVHLFGKNRARASFVQGSWRTSTALWGTTQASVEGIAFLGPDLGYLVGVAVPDGYLGELTWPTGAADATVADLTGDSLMRLNATARSAFFFAKGDGLIATGAGSELLQLKAGAYSSLYTSVGNALNAVHFAGSSGVAVGGTASAPLVVLLDASTEPPTVSTAAAFPPFPNLQDVFVTASGFAVAVGKGGQVAQSFDFGEHWVEKLEVAGASFGRVACLPDGNQCVAVGSYASTGAAAAYQNEAPTGVVLLNQSPNGTPVPDDAPVCLSVVASDPDGDPVQVAWTDANLLPGPSGAPALDKATTAAPPCFTAAAACSGTAFSNISVRVSDGRLSTEIPVSLSLTHPVRPPTSPVLSVRSGGLSWSPGRAYQVDAAATGDCGAPVAKVEFTQSAPLPAPSVSGATAAYDLSGLCLPAETPATLQAVACYASGVCSLSPGALQVTLQPDTSAPTLQLPSSVAVAPGASLAVPVDVRHPCARAFALSASCDDGSAPIASAGAIELSSSDAARCSPKILQCTVTARATDYAPAAAATAAIAVQLEARSPPSSLSIALAGGDRALAPGEAVTLLATVDSPCAQVTWVVRRSSTGAVVASGSGLELQLTAPQDVCGREQLVAEAVESLSGLSASLPLSVEGASGSPSIAPAASFDPSDAPTLRCDAGTSVQLRAFVDVPCGVAQAQASWRQLGDLPLELDGGPSLGQLEVVAAPERFGALIGQTASLELTVSSAGSEVSQTFSVRFLPEPFVQLAHLADRQQASTGEVVWLSLTPTSECASAAPGGIDAHIALEGLEYVEGSAMLAGAPRPDPETDDSGRRVFRALPLSDSTGGFADPSLRRAAERRLPGVRQGVRDGVSHVDAGPGGVAVGWLGRRGAAGIARGRLLRVRPGVVRRASRRGGPGRARLSGEAAETMVS